MVRKHGRTRLSMLNNDSPVPSTRYACAIEPYLNAPTPEVVNDAFEETGLA